MDSGSGVPCGVPRGVPGEEEIAAFFAPEERAVWEKAKGGEAIGEADADAIGRGLGRYAKACGAGWFARTVAPIGGTAAVKYEPIGQTAGGEPAIDGRALLGGEVDASCLPSGEMRHTATAKGCVTWDPAGEVWCDGETLFLPAFLSTPDGEALDERLPLRRAEEAFERAAKRVLFLLGHPCERVRTTAGAEREFFLLRAEDAAKRPDLLYTGCALFGRAKLMRQVRGRHYLLPPTGAAFRVLTDAAARAEAAGIPVRAVHAEAAPRQYEIVPAHCDTAAACERDLRLSGIIAAAARRQGLVCITEEKPFGGVSGSGKHLNWSAVTDKGENPLNIAKPPSDLAVAATFVTAVVAAADRSGELWRASVASFGNDRRLGAAEAPPPVLSVSLGGRVCSLLRDYAAGGETACVDLSAGRADERNRTSPLALAGEKFEFRMPGAARPLRWVNTVWLTTTAAVLEEYADRLAAGMSARALVQSELAAHGRVLYDGDGYAAAWRAEARTRGLPYLPDTPSCLPVWERAETKRLFSSVGVLSERELAARAAVERRSYVYDVIRAAAALEKTASGHLLPALRGPDRAAFRQGFCPETDENDGLGSKIARQARYLRETVGRLADLPAQDVPLSECGALIRETAELSTLCEAAEEALPASDMPFFDCDGLLVETDG